jgi:hypothetical protein
MAAEKKVSKLYTNQPHNEQEQLEKMLKRPFSSVSWL